MPASNRSNPLALAILVSLGERPMHPYEISSTLKRRHKHESVKLNYGSLYAVVATLHKRGLIDPVEKSQDGKLPERTVYALTDGGRAEAIAWLTDLISTPTKDYTGFEAALSFLPTLPPADAARLLSERVNALEQDLTRAKAARRLARKDQIPRLFWIEEEYRTVLREAELKYVRRLLIDISDGTVGGDAWWSSIHTDDHATAPDYPFDRSTVSK